jgi:hypothetical protein
MSKLDVRGYRLLKIKYIYLTMLLYFIVFTLANILLSGSMGLVMVSAFCLFVGWQLGCLAERNDWQMYIKKNKLKDKK